MHLGDAGTKLIQSFESCRLEAYQDGNGIWTIGWGHTDRVQPGDTCTQAQADAWFIADTQNACTTVMRTVDLALTQNEFDALVSLCFNIGGGNFRSSTLAKVLNAGNIMAAADQFLVWNHIGGAVSPGLTRRREAERTLFLTP